MVMVEVPLFSARYPELPEFELIAFFIDVAVPELPPLCTTLALKMLTPFTFISEIVFVDVSSPPVKVPPDALVVEAPPPCEVVTPIASPFCAASFVRERNLILLLTAYATNSPCPRIRTATAVAIALLSPVTVTDPEPSIRLLPPFIFATVTEEIVVVVAVSPFANVSPSEPSASLVAVAPEVFDISKIIVSSF